MTLPLPLTEFIGRKQECTKVQNLLTTRRLVTLTGPAGIGKTRLALEIARQLAYNSDYAVHFIQLSALNEPLLVLPTILQGVSGSITPSSRSVFEKLVSFLATEPTLLVLNNFEQLLPAASEIGQLLEKCPQLRILITSRVPLKLYGETVFPVPPLSLPEDSSLDDLASLAEVEAVAFFLARCCAIQPNFDLSAANVLAISNICKRLEGVPLALEWAATRLKVLPVAVVAEQLEQLSCLPVLQTAFDWSFALLAEPEQALLLRLTVFVGGCSYTAIETLYSQLYNYSAASDDLAASLANLADAGLLYLENTANGEPRFRLRGNVREYAASKLTSADELKALQAAYFKYYATLAQTAEQELVGEKQAFWLATFDQEQANFRAALAWADANQSRDFVGLSASLWRFWFIRCSFEEGEKWLSKVLAFVPETPAEKIGKAKALNGLGTLAAVQGKNSAARDFYHASLGLWREIGESGRIADLLNNLGTLIGSQGDYALAQQYFEESLVYRRQNNDVCEVAIALNNLGSALLYQNKTSEALAVYQEALELRLQQNDQQGIALAYLSLGLTEARRLQYNLALAMFGKSLALFQKLQNHWRVAYCLQEIGIVKVAQNRLLPAVRLLATAATLQSKLKVSLTEADKQRVATALATAEASLDKLIFETVYKDACESAPEKAIALALNEFGRSESPALTEISAKLPTKPEVYSGLLVKVETQSGTIFIGSQALDLRGLQRSLFCYLYEKRGATISIPQLKEQVWSSTDFITDENVHQLVRQVRRKIEKLEPRLDAKTLLVYNPALRGYLIPAAVAQPSLSAAV